MTKIDRQEFFQQAFKYLGKALHVFEQSADGSDSRQRPPGASSNDDVFLNLCVGCDACMAACPVNVIMIEDLEKRDPIIYPDKDPCIRCPGYPCIASCPTGALDLDNGTKPRNL